MFCALYDKGQESVAVNLSLDNSGPGLKLGQGSLVWERARESLMVKSKLMVESSYKNLQDTLQPK